MQPQWKRQGNVWTPFHQAASSTVVSSEAFTAYVTYSELYGVRLSLDDVVARVKKIPRRQWHAFTGLTSMVVDGVGIKPNRGRNRQIELAEAFLKGTVRDEVVRRMEQSNWVWAAPRPLVGLAKLSLAHAPDEVASDISDPLEFMLLTLLALNDHLDKDLELGTQEGRWSRITQAVQFATLAS